MRVFNDGLTHSCPTCCKRIRVDEEVRSLGPTKMQKLYDSIQIRSGRSLNYMYFHLSCLPHGTYPSSKDAGKLLWTSKFYVGKIDQRVWPKPFLSYSYVERCLRIATISKHAPGFHELLRQRLRTTLEY